MTSNLQLRVDEHPLLYPQAWVAVYPACLAELPPLPTAVAEGLAGSGDVPIRAGDEVRAQVRALLRWGGFKPSGRSKPASEYLIKALQDGHLSSINAAVDVCNVVSLHSGFPISVLDLDLCRAPLRLGLADKGQRYVFNPSGQELDLGGLLCLWDRDGPCGSPVKDSQRTKTSGATRQVLTVVWGHNQALPALTSACAWYRQLLRECGAELADLTAPLTP